MTQLILWIISLPEKNTTRHFIFAFLRCSLCSNHKSFFRIMTNGILEKQRLETHKSTLEQLKTIPFPPPLKQNQKFSPSSLELF